MVEMLFLLLKVVPNYERDHVQTEGLRIVDGLIEAQSESL
jgi:hypothetical protein